MLNSRAFDEGIHMYRHLVVVCLVATCADLSAAVLNKCVGENGSVTFTQQACPGGGAGERVDVKSASEGMRVGRPEDVRHEASAPKEVSASVIGGDESTTCAGMDAREIRTMIVRNQVSVGMTTDQAIKAWGKPAKINRSSGGQDQWVYPRNDSTAQYVYVKGGCVAAWN